MSDFLDVFDIGAGDAVAIAGSGGKATLMYRLAREALERGMTVLTTSTTHLHPPTRRQSRGLFVTEEIPDWSEALSEVLRSRRHITVVGARPRPDKLQGVDTQTLTRLSEICRPDLVLIKADGARTRPFKAPGPEEPVVPDWVTRGIVVAGLHSVGLPVDDKHVHRPERVCALAGIDPGQPITEEAIARVVSDPSAYRRAFPAGCRVFLYLSRCDRTDRRASAEVIKKAVESNVYAQILCGNIGLPRTFVALL